MKTTTMSFRIEPQVKSSAERLFAGLGLSITDAVNIFIQQSILQNGIPFDIKYPEDSFYSATHLDLLDARFKEADKQKPEKTFTLEEWEKFIDEKINFTTSAWQDYIDWQSKDKQILKRVNQLIIEILRDPFVGIGKPEPLRYRSDNAWSRRIILEHRIVCRIKENEIEIIEIGTHY